AFTGWTADAGKAVAGWIDGIYGNFAEFSIAEKLGLDDLEIRLKSAFTGWTADAGYAVAGWIDGISNSFAEFSIAEALGLDALEKRFKKIVSWIPGIDADEPEDGTTAGPASPGNGGGVISAVSAFIAFGREKAAEEEDSAEQPSGGGLLNLLRGGDTSRNVDQSSSSNSSRTIYNIDKIFTRDRDMDKALSRLALGSG
ncbi:MAG: hypothetical protein GY859_28340, partial [Desulfobacterales bacterium]|nr:hypothetical protein [Desulfobacterales bacterium]